MKPYSLGPDEGEALWMADVLDTIKASADQTGNSFALWRRSAPRAPAHRCTSSIDVTEGCTSLKASTPSWSATTTSWPGPAPGSLRHGRSHTRRCDSAKGRILALFVPGAFDGFFREVGEPVTDPRRLPPVRNAWLACSGWKGDRHD